MNTIQRLAFIAVLDAWLWYGIAQSAHGSEGMTMPVWAILAIYAALAVLTFVKILFWRNR